MENCRQKNELYYICRTVSSRGVLFLAYLLSYMTIGQILQVIPHILSDGTHSIGIFQKILMWFLSFGEITLIHLFIGMLAVILTVVYSRFRRENCDKTAYFFAFFFLIQIAYQFYCWFTSEHKAFYPLVIYDFLLLSGIFCYQKDKKKSLGDKRKNKACLYLILISLAGYFGVMLLSNWEPIYLMPYLILGALGGLVYLGSYMSNRVPKWKGRALPVLCGILVFSNVFGYCWLYIGGEWNHSSILTVGGINREGLRGGIFTSYMSAYRYNANEEIWREAVPAGSVCLYIGVDQYYYMFGDMRAAGEGSFIRQWLEDDFQASEVTNYSYVTVYKK